MLVVLLIMISVRVMIYISLCVGGITSKPQGTPEQAEDLVDEYYTTILKPDENYIPQDDADANAIVKNDRKEEDIAGILPYRDKIRRFAIQQRIRTKIHAWVSHSSKGSSHTTYYWVTQGYPPQRGYNSTCTFMDLCFGLLYDENIVLAQYLENFLSREDETWTIIPMVLTKTMKAMVKTYDRIHSWSYKFQRKFQKHPFVNMLRAWVRHDRDPIAPGELNHDDVVKDATALKAEHDSHHWHKKSRHQLELILMYKSIKYAREVIKEFETMMDNKPLETIINDCMKDETKLNHDLADAYSSLAKYVKDKHSYIAEILRKYSDGKDYWAAWIMCIAVLHPNEWSKVDRAFQRDHQDGSLTEFITKQLADHKVMAEMIAAIIDPNFKPTTFSVNSVQGGQGGALPTSSPVPPPVPPTVPAPAPAPTPSPVS